MLKIKKKSRYIFTFFIVFLLLGFAYISTIWDGVLVSDLFVAKEKKNQVEMENKGDIDNTEYEENSFATFIQGKKDDFNIKKMFQWKKLDTEFCFVKNNSDDTSIIKCITPSNVTENFDENLKDLWKLDRDDNIKTLTFDEINEDEQMFHLINNFSSGSYIKLSEDIKNKYNKWMIEEEIASIVPYIYWLEGNYEKNKEIIKNNCKYFNIQCTKDTEIILKWIVLNTEKKPIKNATVEVLSDNTVTKVLTNEKWNYQFKFNTHNLSKVRIKASKIGYSEWIIPLNIVGSKKQEHKNLDFVLTAPTKVVTLNNLDKTFIGDDVSVVGNNFIVKTFWSNYKIPFNSFVKKDWTSFNWEVDVFLFEFDKTSWDILNTLARNDIFDEVAWYAGNIMKTFGMPFILLKTKDWESIHILKTNPVVLQNQISEMNALKTNQDGIYRELTKEDMQYLFDKSNELWWYPITKKLLVDPEKLMVHFPAFWIFDQKRGVWENIWVRLLDKKWLIETVFYTVNDQK